MSSKRSRPTRLAKAHGSATLTLNDQSYEFPVYSGTVGPEDTSGRRTFGLSRFALDLSKADADSPTRT